MPFPLLHLGRRRIHQCINIGMIASKLNMEAEECARRVVHFAVFMLKFVFT